MGTHSQTNVLEPRAPSRIPEVEPRPGEPRKPCGSGTILCIDEENQVLLAIPTFCHRWDCTPCAARRVAKARAMAAAGQPERILTLTTRPDPDVPLERAVRWLRKCQTRLFVKIKKEFGRTPYMSFLELHKSGWPHLHILTRGCYIPQRMLSAWWAEITGSWKVYIQKIKRTWKGVNEATKYYLKTAQQVHAACPHAPVYTKSRDWLPADWNDPARPPGSYTFFTFCRIPWEEALATLEALGATIQSAKANPAHKEIRMCGPPDVREAHAIDACGDWGELSLLAALSAIAASPHGLATDIRTLQDSQHYYSRPWGVE